MPYQFLNSAEQKKQLKIHKKDFKYRPKGLTINKKKAQLRPVLVLLNQNQIELAKWADFGDIVEEEEFAKQQNKKLNIILDILLDYIEHQFEMQLLLENPYKWIGEGKIFPRSPLRLLGTESAHWRIQAKWEDDKKISSSNRKIWGKFRPDSLTIVLNRCLQNDAIELLATLIHEICHAIVYWYHREEYNIRCVRKECFFRDCIHCMHWVWWRRFANACEHIFGLHIVDVDKGTTVENVWAKEFIKKHNKPFGPVRRLNNNLFGFQIAQSSNFNQQIAKTNFIKILYLYNVQWKQLYTVQIGAMPAQNCNVDYVKRCFEAQHGIIASSITLFQWAATNVQIFAQHQSLDHYGLREKHKINFALNSFFSQISA